MKLITKILSLSLLLTPVFVSAQNLSWFYGIANQIKSLVDLLIPIVIAIGLLLFIWGLVVYIASSGDEGAKDEGKRKMIWGVIALFVIVSVWGIVALLGTIFGVSAVATPTVLPGV